jgi:hypothetical protein
LIMDMLAGIDAKAPAREGEPERAAHNSVAIYVEITAFLSRAVLTPPLHAAISPRGEASARLRAAPPIR